MRLDLENRKLRIALATGLGAACLALGTGAMANATPNWPARLSSLKVSGLTGYVVRDRDGLQVGTMLQAETDFKGRTRFISVLLDDGGGETRLAAFQAFVNPPKREVDLALPRDVVLARAAAQT